jgi:hypothetical protein
VSRARYGLLVAALAAVVAAGSFLLALPVLDDDGPDSPPDRAGTEPEAPAVPDPAPTTTAASAADLTTGPLDTPAWILVIASEGDQAQATTTAADVATAGHPAGVLRSDDYPSMKPGFWVAFAGPYDDAKTAKAAEPEVEAAGWPGAYVRCAGTVDQCRGREGDDED